MDTVMDERRHSPRYEVKTGELAGLPFSMSVQVLDLTVAGVLLQSSRSLEVGTRGCLRLNVGGTPFVADIEVQRVSDATAARNLTYRMGAVFVNITPENRQAIERFTNQ
jgi:hypothetical protein